MLKEIISHAIKDYVIFQIYTSMQTFVLVHETDASTFEFGELFLLEIIKTSVTLLGVPSISCVVCILSSGATVFLDQRCYGNTFDLFSGSDRAGLVLWRWPFPVLYPCRLVELYQACVPAERGAGAGGMQWEKGETGSCFGHVCISKTRSEDDKRITVDIFSPLKDTCVMLPRIVTFTDQCMSRKIIVFSIFCLSFVLLSS